MVEAKVIPSNGDIMSRNLAVTGEVMRFLMEQPQVFDRLPADFELIILPDDDPELRLHNLELLDRYGSEGKPVVFARLKARDRKRFGNLPANFYVPALA